MPVNDGTTGPVPGQMTGRITGIRIRGGYMKIRKWIAWLAAAAGLLLFHGACAEAPELGLYDPF